ncbi:hypothetical protein [Roseibium sediminis]|uniref:hypothetical protein n=1 Tax=Roseibium sediminis TaxID=1775174 RepID=UPI001375C726|nr:hypothetical protein [Roseibium sediminis]
MRLSSAGIICLMLSAGLVLTAALAQPSAAGDAEHSRAKPVAVGPMERLVH